MSGAGGPFAPGSNGQPGQGGLQGDGQGLAMGDGGSGQDYEPTAAEKKRAEELVAQARENITAGAYGDAAEKLTQSDRLMRTSKNIKELAAMIAPVADIT